MFFWKTWVASLLSGCATKMRNRDEEDDNMLYIYICYICYHENNLPSQLSPQWLCGNSCTWAPDVRLPKCMRCHKTIVVVTGRAHCFHDNIYITLTLLLWDLSTLCDMDHLWPLMIPHDHLRLLHIMYILVLLFLCLNLKKKNKKKTKLIWICCPIDQQIAKQRKKTKEMQ